MARICAAKGDTCYGIELLNEPYDANLDARGSRDLMSDLALCEANETKTYCNGIGTMFTDEQLGDVTRLLGQFYMSRKDNSSAPPKVRYTYRQLLRDLYDKAIKAARSHMDDDKPIVIMDWPVWLPWWQEHARFPYSSHGHITFATHVYSFAPQNDLPSAKAAYALPLEAIRNFTLQSGYEILVTEYALNSHGSGQDDDQFDYNAFANWYVHQISQVAMGSMIWNYDSYWTAWGSVASQQVGNSQMDWKAINTVHGGIAMPQSMCVHQCDA